jgi:hypothetical protein
VSDIFACFTYFSKELNLFRPQKHWLHTRKEFSAYPANEQKRGRSGSFDLNGSERSNAYDFNESCRSKKMCDAPE